MRGKSKERASRNARRLAIVDLRSSIAVPQPTARMTRHRPKRLQHIHGIGVDQMGNVADASGKDLLRLENLDVDIPPDQAVVDYTQQAVTDDECNSYLPFLGKIDLRKAVAEYISKLSGVNYHAERNCTISAGGLSGILNVLLATIEEGNEVIVTDPTYCGLTNRILLAGGVPKYAPFVFNPGQEWKLDREALRSAVTSETTAMLLMSPSMPSGGYFDEDDWKLIAELCVSNDLLLILDTAMERLVFDGRSVFHPAILPGMAERTITVGSASKELRIIGWRVGWIVGPEDLMKDVAAVSMANVVVPVGIAQKAAAIALDESYRTMPTYVAELQARRDLVVSELEGMPVGIPAGGWCLLLRVTDYGLDAKSASRRLLEEGVCATPMDHWGELHGSQYIRFVFSNEPLNRLKGLGARVHRALGLYKPDD